MFARPDQGSATPIQLMPVPVNVIVARAPRAFVNVASPPLWRSLAFAYQLPLYVMLGSFCSTRVTLARDGETLKVIRKGKSGKIRAILFVIIIHSSEAVSPPHPLSPANSNLCANVMAQPLSPRSESVAGALLSCCIYIGGKTIIRP